jgi:glycosyltransferase involved in cell wall biosynthesis
MFQLCEEPRDEYYLCVGRFVPYKKMDLVLQAFQHMPNKKLILIGEGYGSGSIHHLLKQAPNIQWLGYVNDVDMIRYIQKAKACIFAAKEDFGILCVEVQACGTPVIALRNGGYLETVIEGETGYLFDDQTEESIVTAIKKLDESPLNNHKAIRDNALKFSDACFKTEFTGYIDKVMKEYYGDKQTS